MSEQQWLSELASLRSAGSLDFRPARIRWSFRRPYRWSTSLRSLITGTLFDPKELWIDVFDASALSESRALLSVRVEPREQISTVAQGSEALIAGRAEAGAAVVIRVGGCDYWPLYPATVPMRPSRLGSDSSAS